MEFPINFYYGMMTEQQLSHSFECLNRLLDEKKSKKEAFFHIVVPIVVGIIFVAVIVKGML